MVHKLSSILSCRLANYLGWQDKTNIMTYGFELIIGELFKFCLLIIISAYMGLLMPTVLILAAAVPFRLISGGGHCKTYARCTIVTIMIYLLLPMIAYRIMPYFDDTLSFISLLLLTFFTLVAIILWVPGKNPAKDIEIPGEKAKFKKLSRLFLFSWALSCIAVYALAPGIFRVYYVSTAVGFAWQNLFVSPLGYLFLTAVEKVFDLLTTTKEVN
ncbi:MAG: accessory gene regulator ArgB-like protein [Eubacteriales bacterium]